MASSLKQKEAATKRPQTFKKGNTVASLKGKSFKTLVKKAYREVMGEEKVKDILLRVQDGAANGDSQCLQFYFQYMLPKLPETFSPFQWDKDITTPEARKAFVEDLLQKYVHQECSREELEEALDAFKKYNDHIIVPELEVKLRETEQTLKDVGIR